MSKKANIGQLEELHGLMAVYFNKRLKSGDELQAGELNACLAFLKNNHISANITEEKPVQNLLEAFKDMEFEDVEFTTIAQIEPKTKKKK